VVDVVFAGHDPAIGIVFPHGVFSPGESHRVGWDTSEAILYPFKRIRCEKTTGE
jgi:hypothetical protein